MTTTEDTKSKNRTNARLKLAGATAAAALAIAQDQIKPTAADIRTQVMAARASAILEQYLALSAGQMPEHPINPERNTFADLKELFYKIQPASNAIHYAVEAEQMQLRNLLDAARAAGVAPDPEWQRRADLVLAALAAAQGHLRAAAQALVPLLQMGKAGMI